MASCKQPLGDTPNTSIGSFEQYSANEPTDNDTLREILPANICTDTAVSYHEHVPFPNDADLEDGTHTVTKPQAAMSSQQSPAYLNNTRPSLLRYCYNAKRSLFAVLASLIIYSSFQWILSLNILLWICDNTVHYLAVMVLFIITWTTWILWGWNILIDGERRREVLHDLSRGRRPRPLRVQLRAPESCKYLCLGLTVVVGLVLADWRSGFMHKKICSPW